MAGIYGLIGLSDNEHAFVTQVGQRLVFTAANQYLAQISQEIVNASSVFIEEMTTDFKERYKAPGGGRLQEIGSRSRPAAVKARGSWDVAYPIRYWGSEIAYTRRSVAKLTVAELQNDLNTVQIQAVNTLRHRILRRILKNTTDTFSDEDHGALTIQPLANGDGTLYPPVIGSESEADDTHHLESGYAASAISDTNNPFVTISDELTEHYGDNTGGNDVVVFINKAQTAVVEDLTDFYPVEDKDIRSGQDADVPTNMPNIPGKIIGRMTGRGSCWVSQWDWMPANYMLGIHLNAPAPLKMRVALPEWGFPSAITLVSENEDYPFYQADYESVYDVGVGNRLNGVVMELGTGGTYSIPSGYS